MARKTHAPTLNGAPAVIYARFSSHNQRDESIEQQIAECRNYAAAHGLNVVGEYADAAVTGRTDRRPQYQKMRRDAEKGAFSVILAYKSNRIARNMVNALMFEADMERFGVTVLYAKEAFDNTPAGRFALRNMMNMNQFYSENLAEDIIRNQQDNAMKCRANGPAPYGYRSNAEGRFEVDPTTGPIVQEIFRRLTEGDTQIEIAEDFNKRGILTARKQPWGRNSFHSITHNERYMGIYIFNGVRIEGGMPQLISPAQFEEVQNMTRNAKHTRRARAESEEYYQLTGKLYCGECGAPMTGMSGTSTTGTIYYYYACANKRAEKNCTKKDHRRDLLETSIARAIWDMIASDDFIEKLADSMIEFQKKYENNPELAALRERHAANAVALKNIMSAIEQGIITPSTRERLIELEAEKTDLTHKIAALSDSRINVSRDQIVGFYRHFRGGDIDSPEFRQSLFDTFLVKAFVFDNRVYGVFDPNGHANMGVEIKLEDVESAIESSNSDCFESPKEAKSNFRGAILGRMFVFAFSLPQRNTRE